MIQKLSSLIAEHPKGRLPVDDVDKEQKLALADASRPTVSAEHRAAEKEGKDTRLLSACHSSPPL